jgi:hypothetical protein
MAKPYRYVLCIDSRRSSGDLVEHKVYRVLPDATAARRGFIRVIDESGEDYLYPARRFLPIALPRGASRFFAKRSA